MSEFRMFRGDNKLATITQNGGMTVAEVLKAGNDIMKEMRKPCLATIDRVLAKISEDYGPAARQGGENFQTLYELSAHIIDVSAPVADLQIDRAAFSLCELVDRCAGQSAWDWPSVDVHLDALQLLRHAGGALKPDERKKIFDGLNRVNERLPAVKAVEDEG